LTQPELERGGKLSKPPILNYDWVSESILLDL